MKIESTIPAVTIIDKQANWQRDKQRVEGAPRSTNVREEIPKCKVFLVLDRNQWVHYDKLCEKLWQVLLRHIPLYALLDS